MLVLPLTLKAMNNPQSFLAILVAILMLAISSTLQAITIKPTDPPSMSVRISAGKMITEDGRQITWAAQQLDFEPPEITTFTATNRQFKMPSAPENFRNYFNHWSPWPEGTPKQHVALGISPKKDEQGTLILGQLYRVWQHETILVKDQDGKVYTRDIDYRVNEDWGQIANIENRLGEPLSGQLTVTAKAALSRIDLIQSDTLGTLSVKRGESVIVCPQLPEADVGCEPIAGIYIAPWRVSLNPNRQSDDLTFVGEHDKYAITSSEIFVIDPAPLSQPFNPTGIAKTIAKMVNGKKVTIAFMGDAVTDGGEATNWYNAVEYGKDSPTFRAQFISGLRDRFPEADIVPINGFSGNQTIIEAVNVFSGKLAKEGVDLVVVAHGGLEVDGQVGKQPRVPLKNYREAMTTLVRQAKQVNSEVVIVATHPLMPWLGSGAGERQPEYVHACKEIAVEEQVAFVDVFSDFKNLNTHGIPFYSQIHNWKNHPGDLGHDVYSNALLRLFDLAMPSEPAPLVVAEQSPTHPDPQVSSVGTKDIAPQAGVLVEKASVTISSAAKPREDNHVVQAEAVPHVQAEAVPMAPSVEPVSTTSYSLILVLGGLVAGLLLGILSVFGAVRVIQSMGQTKQRNVASGSGMPPIPAAYPNNGIRRTTPAVKPRSKPTTFQERT